MLFDGFLVVSGPGRGADSWMRLRTVSGTGTWGGNRAGPGTGDRTGTGTETGAVTFEFKTGAGGLTGRGAHDTELEFLFVLFLDFDLVFMEP